MMSRNVHIPGRTRATIILNQSEGKLAHEQVAYDWPELGKRPDAFCKAHQARIKED
jgi:hypothetical protein